MTWLASEACVPSQLSNGGGTLAIGPLQGWALSELQNPWIEGFQEAQASPEPLLSGSQATGREGQGWGPIAFLILPLPGWPGVQGRPQPPPAVCWPSLWGLSGHRRNQIRQMFVDTEQVIHFAWAQAAVLGCEGVCRTEVRNTQVHRAQHVSKFRKCLGCETRRKLSTFSRGQPPTSPWQVGSQVSHSKEARHLTGQYSLAKS